MASKDEQVYTRIRGEIRLRLLKTGAPDEVAFFLLDRWSRLLGDIYLSVGDGHPDWLAGWETVDALLWSLAPKKDRAETERLLRLLPTLMGRLQEGCEAMGMPRAEQDALFAQLAMLHAALARAGLGVGPDDAGPVTQLSRDADLAMGEAELADLAHQEAEIQSLIRVSEQPPAPPAGTPSLESRLARLRVGDGARVELPEGWKRLKIQWISGMGGMFLFADEQGFDSFTLTRARLLERMQEGKIQLD